MQHFTRFTRLGVIFFALAWLLAACTTGERAPFFQAPTIGDVTIDGDTITITGANFFQVQDGSTLPTNLTITVCGELLGNLVLNGETKTVVFAPGTVATITTATKIIGTLTGVFVGEHDGIRITNPDGQTINIDVDCEGEPEPEEPEGPGEPATAPFEITINFDLVQATPAGVAAPLLSPEPFTTFFLPITGIGEISIDWGDGSSPTVITNPHKDDFSQRQHLYHTYEAVGEYVITATGDLIDVILGDQYPGGLCGMGCMGSLAGYSEADSQSIAALVSLDSWGPFEYAHLDGAFVDAINLTQVPDHLPEGVTSIKSMFYGATSFNGDISGWDTSDITNMYQLFQGASSFDNNIGGWDVSKVEDMGSMFAGASSFTQEIGDWVVRNVTMMDNMFNGATSFNGEIGDWNVSGAINMDRMFYGATAFDGDLSRWCTRIKDEPVQFNTGSKFEDAELKQPQWNEKGCLQVAIPLD